MSAARVELGGVSVTPEEIRTKIAQEIERGWDEKDPRSNPHGVELSRCLLAVPERRTFLDSFDENSPIELWLVLEEQPDDQSGYEIVYNEDRDIFGLAIKGSRDSAVLIGYYGSFLETLAGM